ncbi:MAG: hypothetical protein HY293_09515 [Planctomycetes bacterium]|nr:hypothetical protein [Planctomycetota bacterium]
MDGLKRLSGAKEVSQDDFAAGVGTYIVHFDAPPKVSIADVKKNVGKYKVEEIRLKITVKAPAEGKQVGDLTLAGDDQLKELAALKGKMVVLSGVLSEDDKGKQTLTLSKVAEAAAK